MWPDNHRRWSKCLWVLIGIFATIGIAYTMLPLGFFVGGVCTVEQEAIIPSPSTEHVASVSLRTCGRNAPTTEVSVSHGNTSSRSRAVAIVFSASKKMDRNGNKEGIPVSIAWLNSKALEVSYPYAVAFTSRVDRVDDIKVSYKEISPR